MSLSNNTLLENRYRVETRLAQGGMGAVYRGFDTKLQIPLAIKENFLKNPHSIQQFEKEALILARLNHPNLPRVIDHFTFQGQQYLVMDFIEGQDLWNIIKRTQRPVEEDKALHYIMQVCEAVSYLHRQHPPIIHRDIKPQNIKITPAGQAVLVDFGIAKMAHNNDRTQTGARGVTPGFSPPEQYGNMGTTPASDVYSLGATLYALLTAQKPPDSINLMAGGEKFKPPHLINTQLSSHVSKAIEHAMKVQMLDRPQSVDQWQQMLTDTAITRPMEEDETLVNQPLVMSPGFRLVATTGQTYPLKIGSQTLGRAKDSDIPIADRLASRQHATLKFDGQQCTIYDNHSANGTFIISNTGEQPVKPTGQLLKPGDKLRIGQVILTLANEAAVTTAISADGSGNTTGSIATELISDSPPVAPPPVQQVATSPTNNNQFLWMVIAVGVIALVILGGVIIYLMLPNDGNGRGSEVASQPTATLTTVMAPIDEITDEATLALADSKFDSETPELATATPLPTSTEPIVSDEPSTDQPIDTPTPIIYPEGGTLNFLIGEEITETVEAFPAQINEIRFQFACQNLASSNSIDINLRQEEELYQTKPASSETVAAWTTEGLCLYSLTDAEMVETPLSWPVLPLPAGQWQIDFLANDETWPEAILLTSGKFTIATPPPRPVIPQSHAQPVELISVQSGNALNLYGSDPGQPEQIGQFVAGISTAARGPAWSPDGNQVAFVDLDNTGVWLMNRDGSNPHRIIDLPNIKTLAWSPDGTKFALHIDQPVTEIQIRETNGNLVAKFPGKHPVWAADSQHLAINRNCYNGQCGIWLVDFLGSQVAQLTNIDGDNFPALSPDGQYLAFSSNSRHQNFEIYLLDISSNQPPTRLTNRPTTEYMPVFSPDSKEIYFLTDVDTAWRIRAIDLAGQRERAVADGVGPLAPEGLSRPTIRLQ